MKVCYHFNYQTLKFAFMVAILPSINELIYEALMSKRFPSGLHKYLIKILPLVMKFTQSSRFIQATPAWTVLFTMQMSGLPSYVVAIKGHKPKIRAGLGRGGCTASRVLYLGVLECDITSSILPLAVGQTKHNFAPIDWSIAPPLDKAPIWLPQVALGELPNKSMGH